MADPGDVKGEVTPQNSEKFESTQTVEEVQAAAAAAEADSPESLGVDQASFDKYYKDGNFDWASYGKEQAFKAKQKAEPTEQASDNADEVAEDASKTADVQEVVEKAGVDWDDLTAQLAADGGISDGDRQKLVDMGIPEVVIDDYIRIATNEVQSHVTNVMNKFGGEENFEAIYHGLMENATEDQRDQIDSLLRDEATIDAGIQLAYQLSKVEGAPAPQTQADVPAGGPQNAVSGAANVTPFGSFDEMVAAQRDPRYKTDPAYRDEFMKRAAASQNIDMNPRLHSGGM